MTTTHFICFAIQIGKYEWQTYKRDNVDDPEPQNGNKYYNPM